MALFRLRLNCIDHYQAAPSRFDPQLFRPSASSQAKDAPKVPVIRVFGATPTGQKVCAHIHGALPYLYIEYDGNLAPDEVGAYISRLHLSIDHALAVSYRRNLYDGKINFVGRITLVKGVPFYGFHVGDKLFLKIYILNPLNMTRLADLLRQGTILKRVFQPYESHLQYLLQWMCDYNLYGCGYIDCSKVSFRNPIPDHEEMTSTVHLWHTHSISENLTTPEDELPRQSHCALEVDICVQDIVNRNEIKPRPIHHDFIERTRSSPPDEKLVFSMAGLWRDETRRRKAKMPDADSGSSPFPPEVLISMSADNRKSQKGGWVHEEEYAELVKAVMQDEKKQSNGSEVSFDSFIHKLPLESTIKSAFESVTDLFPENIDVSTAPEMRPERHRVGEYGTAEVAIDVDEVGIPALVEDDFSFDSDEEGAQERASANELQVQDPHEGHQGNPLMSNGDDEARPDGSRYAEQFHDPFDIDPDEGSTSPPSMAGMGVRDAETSDHLEEDAFDIPLEYASDFSTVEDPSKRLLVPEVFNGQSRKKRKVVHDERPAVMDNLYAHNTQDTSELSGSPSSTGLALEMNPTDAMSVEDPRPTLHIRSDSNGIHKVVAQAVFPDTLERPPKTASQKLSFPVVKDPNNPNTILRLSQRSDSSRGSVPFRDKNISFDETRLQPGQSQLSPDETSVDSLNDGLEKLLGSVALKVNSSFTTTRRSFCWGRAAPSSAFVSATMQNNGLLPVLHQDAFYSDEKDVPERAREYAGREFRLESLTVPFLSDFNPNGGSMTFGADKTGLVIDREREEKTFRRKRRACKINSWEIKDAPPTMKEVQAWFSPENSIARDPAVDSRSDNLPAKQSRRNDGLSQIDATTQKNRHGFKFTQKQKSTSVQHEEQYMSVMSLEVHVNTRADFVPNPDEDEVACIFWCVQGDETLDRNTANAETHVGILALSEAGDLATQIARHVPVQVEEQSSELDLITRMVDIVRMYDPDILTGYEVHNGSWGYLIERARCKYEYNLCDEFSRMKSQSHGRFGKDNDRWGFNHTSTIRVTGRHMINIWRAMRSELNLLQYTMENVAFHLLHRRIPHYHYRDLTAWYTSGKARNVAKVVDYYVGRVQTNLAILEENELISRTSEQARLLGVDFFSVFSRGSQFKVESLMFRIAKPENFLLVSPSRKQVGQQNALECLPLVMEPQSDFYSSPLLVLDFQSLYPSVMIAYNYCYSTYLGRVVNWRGQNKMGFTNYERERRLLELLQGHVNIAPNGIMYSRPAIRKSLLAKMLGEILETRVMVKSGMKVDKDDKTLQRLLNNRQLALKLIANVTYGYTSASFSGRMPCSEIADSIVQTGRETLEKAIALIHSVKRWGAEVVYGDTDSLFVYLKGRGKDEAFDIGNEIAKVITNMNPQPVKLKFEKVYFPCVLLAKKRYVGFKYESKSQQEPEFDAKGIETVRRDGTPAEQKIEEKALKILFRTADLSQVKQYFQRQCSKIMKGKVSVQDFCFAKEVKLGTYSDKGLPPPGALISTRRMMQDPRLEPQYGERVPYVVMTGAPGARLIDRCVAPETLLQDDHSELDAEYYISKNLIPPLERIFNLVGANVRSWYDEMPKFQRIRRVEGSNITASKDLVMTKKTLESYMKSSLCLVCRVKLESDVHICNDCLEHGEKSLLTLRARLAHDESHGVQLEKVCRSCAGLAWGEEVKCDSKDCPVFYTRTRHMASLNSTKAMVSPMLAVLEGRSNALDW
ncbi:MAG: DNA polymerase zeta [Piccolia ochrophora]|nr:MAG: DNA polymerase zeta [Piccolia ochrophora]